MQTRGIKLDEMAMTNKTRIDEGTSPLVSKELLGGTMPFTQYHGFQWLETDDNGDCFYISVSIAFRGAVTVYDQRVIVSESFGMDQYEFYMLQALLGGDENRWAEYLRQQGRLDDLTCIKDFILVEGSTNQGDCIWADQFAINIIGLVYNINILFVDMDRNMDESPCRWLYKSTEEDADFIVLKREHSHYQPLQDSEGRSKWTKSELPPAFRDLWF